MTDKRLEWKWGEKTLLANRSGISPQYLSDILAGRKGAHPELAIRIEDAARDMGLYISRMDVVFPKESSNPLMNAALQKHLRHVKYLNKKLR